MLKIALCLCVVVVAVNCDPQQGGGAGYSSGGAGYSPGGAGYSSGGGAGYSLGAYPRFHGQFGSVRHSGAYIPDPLNAAYPPIPFSFNYVAPAIGGSSSRTEQGDGNGRVTGSYTINDADGRSRVVNYVADAAGFRAQVETNEPGTLTSNAADAIYRSNAPPVVYGPPSGGYLGATSTAYRYGAAAGIAGVYGPGAAGRGHYV